MNDTTRLLRPTLALAGLLAASTALAGQNRTAEPVSGPALDALQLRAGNRLSLQLPESPPHTDFDVDVALGPRAVRLRLSPFDIRAPGFELLVHDGESLRRAPAGPLTTYRGHVVGQPDVPVAATLFGGQLWADIHMPDHHWFVEPMAPKVARAARSDHVAYRRIDATVPPGAGCGGGIAVPGAPVGLDRNGSSPASSTLRYCEIAVDVDHAFYTRNNRDLGAARSAVFRVMNSVDAIFRRDVTIAYRIVRIIVRTQPPFYRGRTIDDRLPEFRDRWDRDHRDIHRDLAHLFTGVGSFRGTVGLAYLGDVVCSQRNSQGRSFGYGASKAYSNHANNVGLVSHELGHNWNTQHCNGSSTCNIMCATIGGCSDNRSEFAPVSRRSILASKATRPCLERPVDAVMTPYGHRPCYGSERRPERCLSYNSTRTTSVSRNTSDEFAFGFANTTGRAMFVLSVEFFTRRNASASSTRCWFYRAASPTTPNLLSSTSGTMSPGTGFGWYRATFTTPQRVEPGERFWVSQNDTRNFRVPEMTFGQQATVPTNVRRSGTTGSWRTTTLARYPAVRVTCNITLSPVLRGIGKLIPAGRTPTLELSRTAIRAVTVFAIGSSDSSWGGLPLPLGLAPLGAPGCFVVASPDLLFPGVANTSGVATMLLRVPPVGTLVGSVLYAQGVGFDRRANSLGMTFSNGLRIVIGNQ